jgi:UDP-N-acetylmuramoyl-L-alanyl-D-glutamate--2,6-diaminopimelate ligase
MRCGSIAAARYGVCSVAAASIREARRWRRRGVAIVLPDNPRSENPRSITHGITAGIKSHGARVINDRSEAIATALTEAAAGDMVLIAGKGHEDYQIYGDVRRSFSDRAEALRHHGAAA